MTHKGRSSNSGHYVAWVKYKGDTWIECNDDDVNPVHVEDVMKLSGGGETTFILDGTKMQMYLLLLFAYICILVSQTFSTKLICIM